jgi:hypothetical protein
MTDPDNWERRALLIASRLNDAADELRDLITALRVETMTKPGPKPTEEEGLEPDARDQS